jgi:TorA maturation chaperone TorD
MRMSMRESVAVDEPPQVAAVPGLAPEDLLRANAYSLLSRLLASPPDAGVVALLQGIDPGPGDGSEMGLAWHTLRLAARGAVIEDLDDEFHALFIGVGRGELVPYGSWYLTGFLLDQPLAVLRRDLIGLGLERRGEVREPEDHAAALCECMALIIRSAGQTSLPAQREFFQRHVESWMGRFFQDMQHAPSARFYRAVGQLGEQFLALEARYLALER